MLFLLPKEKSRSYVKLIPFHVGGGHPPLGRLPDLESYSSALTREQIDFVLAEQYPNGKLRKHWMRCQS